MNPRSIHVLLLADDPDEIQLVEEAFEELREVQFTRPWLAAGEFEVAESAEEALEMLAGGRYDALVADLAILGGSGSAFLRRVNEKLPELPVLFLVAHEEEMEGFSLLRQGAQDCLLKSELDCLPLARALQASIERSRTRAALRSVSLIDELTGLYSRRGFLELSERFLSVAEWASAPMLLHLFALERAGGADPLSAHFDRDLALILLAEALRERASGPEIAGRVSNSEVAVLSAGDGSGLAADGVAADVARKISREDEAGDEVAHSGAGLTIRTATIDAVPGTAPAELLSAARAALCENRRARSTACR